MLENRQKELKGTIHNLLQSRENFVNAYQVRWKYDIGRDYHAMLSVFFDPVMSFVSNIVNRNMTHWCHVHV